MFGNYFGAGAASSPASSYPALPATLDILFVATLVSGSRLRKFSQDEMEVQVTAAAGDRFLEVDRWTAQFGFALLTDGEEGTTTWHTAPWSFNAMATLLIAPASAAGVGDGSPVVLPAGKYRRRIRIINDVEDTIFVAVLSDLTVEA